MKQAGETSYANNSNLYPIITKLKVAYNYGYVKGMYCLFHVLKFLIFVTDGPSGHFLPLN